VAPARVSLRQGPGVFGLDGPATALFSNFDVVARQVTLLHYTDDLGLPQPLIKLMPVEPPAGSAV